ncbi:DMSO/TMAO reductase YedYZ heme-binding membrane subunit [Caulobacter ginsengisoli]|uniref:DMSO/TMAO reductase YedYZ heme-binding membrane subunit n=1 Tax=Caulobacter ginsengisoli TaxID=400775 RepID=A0ABU0IXL2_9CAUL|nr:hypothetical protein [Caulobacter ginsengisoli]MDQ0466081.1 DMSO/TMAO reductase YedYZ heme-binding membrane subunit [Caulobacter ginsengisoli]
MKITNARLVGLAAMAAVLIALTGMALAGGWTREGALMATRLTARWSFPWFMAAWMASSLAAVWPGGWRAGLLRRRRGVGLAFAANHGVHLVFILISAFVFNVETARIQILGGGFGYLLIALMAATSNNASVRLLGPKLWRVLHSVGGWVVLGIFTNSYVGRLDGKPWLAIPALGLIALALALRLAAWLGRRQRLQAA